MEIIQPSHDIGEGTTHKLPMETRHEFHDPFMDVLPLLLSEEPHEQTEPKVESMHPDVQRRYRELLEQRVGLEAQGRFPTGTDVAILVSDVGTNEVEAHLPGADEPIEFTSYETSEDELAEHTKAADGIKHRIGQLTGNAVNVTIHVASQTSIEEAIKDARIAHVIFIGHANSSDLAVTPTDNFSWDDPRQPIDHLKLSFGVFGCGIPRSGDPVPRVGWAVVPTKGILYGVGKDFFEEGTPYDFDQLVRLSSSPLPNNDTPQELVA